MRYLLFSFFIIVSFFSSAQRKLRVGEKIPFSKIVLFNHEDKKTDIDLPNGKTFTDKFVLVLFYNTKQPVKHIVDVNQRLEQILNRFQNNACKGASEIEYITICAEEKPAAWKRYLQEGNLMSSKFNGKKTNYLAKNGVKDEAVKVFCADKFPSFFLVNPKGRLWLETDSTEALEQAFYSICKMNASASTADIAGKLLVGDKEKKPLMKHPVYLINQKSDTVKSTITDGFGDFTFNKVDTTQNLTIRVAPTDKEKHGPLIFLAKLTGEIITEFKKTIKGDFEYRLLKVDLAVLSPLEESDDIILKYKKFEKTGEKNLLASENIYYELNKFTVTLEGELALDKIVTILNANPKVNLEVISHTDARGDDGSNMTLSQKRSNSVVEYLSSKGIDKSRLKAVGKGESEIKNRCLNGVDCSDKEHEFNRRTEFNFSKN
jgi:outer membrane protein OmpA-like peptidoglycan-associated protein